MKPDDIINLFSDGANCIQFEYNGKNGLIDPFVNGRGIYSFYYGDEEVHLDNAGDIMAYPMFDGKSLNEIYDLCEFIQRYIMGYLSIPDKKYGYENRTDILNDMRIYRELSDMRWPPYNRHSEYSSAEKWHNALKEAITKVKV